MTWESKSENYVKIRGKEYRRFQRSLFLSVQAANWTGYGIIYELLDPFSPSQRVYGLCQELDKVRSSNQVNVVHTPYIV